MGLPVPRFSTFIVAEGEALLGKEVILMDVIDHEAVVMHDGAFTWLPLRSLRATPETKAKTEPTRKA